MKIYQCQSCVYCTSTINDLILHPEDIFERVAPGEVMPEGECPECGALVHAEETKKRRFRPITKTRVLEGIRRVKTAARDTFGEVDRLTPGLNPHHAKRMQSILGASIIRDLDKAQESIENATRKVRAIRGSG